MACCIPWSGLRNRVPIIKFPRSVAAVVTSDARGLAISFPRVCKVLDPVLRSVSADTLMPWAMNSEIFKE